MIVSVRQLKRNLRIQHDDEDSYLRELIHVAQAAAEDFCQAEFGRGAPLPARLAVILMASHLYEYRSVHDRRAYLTMRTAFESLLWPYRDTTKLF